LATSEINAYYDASEQRDIRDDIKQAIGLVQGQRVAIDCGCGAGSDTSHWNRAREWGVLDFEEFLETEAVLIPAA